VVHRLAFIVMHLTQFVSTAERIES